jgi:hypothetical protein
MVMQRTNLNQKPTNNRRAKRFTKELSGVSEAVKVRNLTRFAIQVQFLTPHGSFNILSRLLDSVANVYYGPH